SAATWSAVFWLLSIGFTGLVGADILMSKGVIGMNHNEASAAASLKTLMSAEADFRANDRDANKVNDFWVADVAALYGLVPATGGESIKLIELSVAAADAAPLSKSGFA